MRSKVEGALLYGSMFLCMAPGYLETLEALQVELERTLMGMPPWTPAEVMRALAGWNLGWGERVVVETLQFRAELWCTAPDLLVHSVWLEAQNLPGRTFARVSSDLLAAMSVQEVYNTEAWSQPASDKKKVLELYKAQLRIDLERRSCAL